MSKLYLIAHIAGRAVAIDSDQVDSVVDIPDVTPVPGCDARVRGLAALRSRVVTVIDTCAALGLAPSKRPAGRAVITHVDGHNYAILVDTLEDVAPFTLAPLDGGISIDGGWRSSACGFIDRDGEPMLAIDLRALIPGLTAVAA